MSDKKISELSQSAALTGSEIVPIVQDGDTVQTTAQDIADLAAATEPTDIVIVNTSRDFLASDVGKLLYITAPDVTLTMPVTPPFNALDKVYIYPNVNTKYEVSNGTPISLLNATGGTNPFVTAIFTGTYLYPLNGLVSTIDGAKEQSLYFSGNILQEKGQNTAINAAPEAIFDVAVPVGDAVGGSFSVTTIVKDGTDIQVVTDIVSYTAIEVSGVITGDIVKSTTSTHLTSGTLTTAYSIVQNPVDTERISILITATSSLTPTSMVSRAKLINNTNSITY